MYSLLGPSDGDSIVLAAGHPEIEAARQGACRREVEVHLEFRGKTLFRAEPAFAFPPLAVPQVGMVVALRTIKYAGSTWLQVQGVTMHMQLQSLVTPLMQGTGNIINGAECNTDPWPQLQMSRLVTPSLVIAPAPGKLISRWPPVPRKTPSSTCRMLWLACSGLRCWLPLLLNTASGHHVKWG